MAPFLKQVNDDIDMPPSPFVPYGQIPSPNYWVDDEILLAPSTPSYSPPAFDYCNHHHHHSESENDDNVDDDDDDDVSLPDPTIPIKQIVFNDLWEQEEEPLDLRIITVQDSESDMEQEEALDLRIITVYDSDDDISE
ncbi:unnamed protein product [Ceutorhynchus assimilis]|uniref:Uncharacterized protein n=1 Tax=Ceutorhynchus assimilis TaxID=467358 RepID=A0A9N9MJ96_9CUCU|nr:unnamed protein product [Ceutorhynchus assimilis]CAG9768407.1 unnamed protein product [Ceutorhynchus assimilis]CAG9771520.1 unnamed protein product [Ceutorhynchus assimilis]